MEIYYILLYSQTTGKWEKYCIQMSHVIAIYSSTAQPLCENLVNGRLLASVWLILCWRVAPCAPEDVISICLRGQATAPFAPIHFAHGPGKVTVLTCVCVHGTVCFRYNVCVHRCSAFFSWLSVAQSLRTPGSLPGYPFTAYLNQWTNWTWHLFRDKLRRPLLRPRHCSEE